MTFRSGIRGRLPRGRWLLPRLLLGLGALVAIALGGSSAVAIAPKDGGGAATAAVPDAPEGSAVLDVTATTAHPAPRGVQRMAQAARPAEAEAKPAAKPAGSSAKPAGSSAKPAGSSAKPAGSSDRPGLLSTDSDQPLSIKADELEAVEKDGRRQLLFNRSVHVEQGDLTVHSDRLAAYYAANAKQPERLVASGNVRVRQRARELSCNTATYYPADERLECVGSARLQDGENMVRGDRIEILFDQDRIRVQGSAIVNVTPEKKKPAAEAAATPATPSVQTGATP